MYASRKGRTSRLGRVGRSSPRGLGDGLDWNTLLPTILNDAASVAKVAVQPTTNISSMVSPTGVQSYQYSAPGYGSATGVASLSGGSGGIVILGLLGLGAVLLLSRR